MQFTNSIILHVTHIVISFPYLKMTKQLKKYQISLSANEAHNST